MGLNDGNWGWGPYLFFSDATVKEGNSGTASATFTLTLAHASNVDLMFHYATADGTATGGSDYQAASGALTFAPGETSKTSTVLINGDRLPEPNEPFFVNLSSPTNAAINDGQGVGTIRDDEPRISISDVTRYEGRKNHTTLFTFTVTLSAAYDEPVSVSYRSADGTATTSDNDYVARTGTLTFAPARRRRRSRSKSRATPRQRATRRSSSIYSATAATPCSPGVAASALSSTTIEVALVLIARGCDDHPRAVCLLSCSTTHDFRSPARWLQDTANLLRSDTPTCFRGCLWPNGGQTGECCRTWFAAERLSPWACERVPFLLSCFLLAHFQPCYAAVPFMTDSAAPLSAHGAVTFLKKPGHYITRKPGRRIEPRGCLKREIYCLEKPLCSKSVMRTIMLRFGS